jgi:hypothetical protein
MRNLARIALVIFAIASVGCQDGCQSENLRACATMCAPAPVDRYENGSCYCSKVNPEPCDAGVKK